MSHSKERKEKICLNCNAVINGKYCSICGQENLEPQESVWSLVVHFFNDITHFDGKFFSSVKYVLTQPGFLTGEYVRGRRMSYLNPVRFYVFTSFLFFLIFFSFMVDNDASKEMKIKNKTTKADSVLMVKILRDSGIDSLKIDSIYKNIKIDSLKNLPEFKKKKNNFKVFNLFGYDNRQEFDSLEKNGKVNRGRIERMLIEKQFRLQEKYSDDPEKGKEALYENLLHSIPQTLFFTLPLFALVLQLLYMRSKKHFYVSHVIFTIHLYIFIYLDILLMYLLGLLSKIKYLGWLSTVEVIFGLAILYYAYRAMRNFYEQNRWKTLLKLFILCFALLFLSVIFAIVAFSLSIYKM